MTQQEVDNLFGDGVIYFGVKLKMGHFNFVTPELNNMLKISTAGKVMTEKAKRVVKKN